MHESRRSATPGPSPRRDWKRSAPTSSPLTADSRRTCARDRRGYGTCCRRDCAGASRCGAGGERIQSAERCGSRSGQIRAGQGGAAGAVARGTERRSRHARDRTRLDRQPVGRALRHRPRGFEARAPGRSWRGFPGILALHPGLRLEVEGHTDDVGSDDANQRLSERRGESVRAYLVQQGIASATVGTIGLGETKPVATNGTAAGRQLNRRVELIVSGESIGTL